MGQDRLERDKKRNKKMERVSGEMKWRGAMKNLEESENIQILEQMVRSGMGQAIQKDCSKVEKSKYRRYYKNLKKDINMEE